MVFEFLGGGKVDEGSRRVKEVAATGDLTALYNLGVAYLNGIGVNRDLRTAYDAFSKAANSGHSRAQYNLGVMHNTGAGAELNAGLAAFWFEKSAAQGHPDAAFNLSYLYLNGSGVKQSPLQAQQYLSLAAKNGHAKANEILQKIKVSGQTDAVAGIQHALSTLRDAASDVEVRRALKVGLGPSPDPNLLMQVTRCHTLAEQVAEAANVDLDDVLDAMVKGNYLELEQAMRAGIGLLEGAGELVLEEDEVLGHEECDDTVSTQDECRNIADDLLGQVFGANSRQFILRDSDCTLIESHFFSELHEISRSEVELKKHPEAREYLDIFPIDFVKQKFLQSKNNLDYQSKRIIFSNLLSGFPEGEQLQIKRFAVYLMHEILMKRDFGDQSSWTGLSDECEGLTREAEKFIADAETANAEERRRNWDDFHRLWGGASRSPAYNKNTWLEIEEQLRAAKMV